MWTSDLGNGTYKNPVVYADYSDPDVIRVGEDFFMTASNFNFSPGLPILHSKDLVNWKVVSYALERMPYPQYDLPQHGKGVWAPALRYHDGEFYIYFGALDEGVFMVKTILLLSGKNQFLLKQQMAGLIPVHSGMKIL